jgi:hypothetical protein
MTTTWVLTIPNTEPVRFDSFPDAMAYLYQLSPPPPSFCLAREDAP